MQLTLTEDEVKCLRAAFLMYQKSKRQEAAQNTDNTKVKGYATVLGLIETLQTKLGFEGDRCND